jgi:hypothetical protein
MPDFSSSGSMALDGIRNDARWQSTSHREVNQKIEIVTEGVGRNSAEIHRTTHFSCLSQYFPVKEIEVLEITE